MGAFQGTSRRLHRHLPPVVFRPLSGPLTPGGPCLRGAPACARFHSRPSRTSPVSGMCTAQSQLATHVRLGRLLHGRPLLSRPLLRLAAACRAGPGLTQALRGLSRLVMHYSRPRGRHKSISSVLSLSLSRSLARSLARYRAWIGDVCARTQRNRPLQPLARSWSVRFALCLFLPSGRAVVCVRPFSGDCVCQVLPALGCEP